MRTQEIEKKYLVKFLPEDLEQNPKDEILQGYIAITPNGDEVRLRHKGNKYYQTVKGGGSGIRFEIEIEITKTQFDSLWQTTEGKRIEKTRYKIPYKDKTIELDIYHGNLKELMTAEIEFDSEKEGNKFTPPDWFGEEVTQTLEYKNQNLALYGIPKKGRIKRANDMKIILLTSKRE